LEVDGEGVGGGSLVETKCVGLGEEVGGFGREWIN